MNATSRSDAARKAAEATYTVTYPSGRCFTVTGALFAGVLDGCGWNPAVDTGSEVVELDPRGIVTAASGKRVLGPRDVPLDVHASVFVEWLIEHPDWDRQP